MLAGLGGSRGGSAGKQLPLECYTAGRPLIIAHFESTGGLAAW